ncbi:MAG: anhydro-N-acetylmuramic acid kinase [Candidatus Angelobacter sp. Gp1-AA117]|nr:MAG: anhydro-N-acetylmuramic acid kinase [Candidatus Angelobacter sp. Gp1-AA117]
MIIAGVMSGTSADGIDVALVRVLGRGFNLRFELLGHGHFDYPEKVQKAVLKAMNAASISVAELARLNFLLGELYAEAIRKAQQRTGTREIELVGCHGQTIYHQGDSAPYLGKKFACTWQTGEGSVIAARLGVPVVSDFRPADMAAGGQGAPLVPFLDYVVFRHRRAGRIVQNIGGIANLSAIPASARPEQVLAFDTGPGNMVIDQLTQLLFDKPFDRNGAIAGRGRILEPVLKKMLRNPFFHQKPPKTAGREEFGREYAKAFLRRCGKAKKEDVIATATALTARSISAAIRDFVVKKGEYRDYIVSGGGSRNLTLMKMLSQEIAASGLKLRHSDEFGVPSQAKEAIAFALLAYQTWQRQPGNIPSATGAKRAAILGKISYV